MLRLRPIIAHLSVLNILQRNNPYTQVMQLLQRRQHPRIGGLIAGAE